MSQIKNLNQESFDQVVLGAEGPVVVDFWAPWCAPCRHLAPILEEVAEAYAGRATFTKVNVDESPSLVTRYGIFGVPTVIVFKVGTPATKLVGWRSKGDITKALDRVLAA